MEFSDFDGDGSSDIAVYRNGLWIYKPSTGGANIAAQFGGGTDVPLPADYDGDGKTDVAVNRNGLWIILRSDGGMAVVWFGGGTDVPVPADYDGDGETDIAVVLKRFVDHFAILGWGSDSDPIWRGRGCAVKLAVASCVVCQALFLVPLKVRIFRAIVLF